MRKQGQLSLLYFERFPTPVLKMWMLLLWFLECVSLPLDLHVFSLTEQVNSSGFRQSSIFETSCKPTVADAVRWYWQEQGAETATGGSEVKEMN